MKQTAYIGLGSNLGDRGDALMAAVKLIAQTKGISVKRLSQFLQTKPAGGPPDQPKYLNAAAEVETTLTPQQLLAVLNDIERTLGRNRKSEIRWGPRTCDLDILLFGQTVLQTDELTIPHPRMHERRFVLKPLAEIAPQACHPVLKKTITDLLGEVEGQ